MSTIAGEAPGPNGKTAPPQPGYDAPAFDAGQVRRFLELIRPDGEPVTLAAIVPDKDIEVRTFVDLDDAVTWSRARNEIVRNVYYTLNLPQSRVLSKKPTKQDIAASIGVWSDVDPRASEPLAAERRRLMQLADELAALEMPPTFITDSGAGLQPAWMFEAAIDTDLAEWITQVELLCRRIEAALGAKGTANVDRLLRLPGCVNYANKVKLRAGRPERSQARLLHVSGRTYGWRELHQLASHLEDAPLEHAVPVPLSKGNGHAADVELGDEAPEPMERARIDALCAAGPRFAKAWVHQDDAPDQTMSGYDYRLCKLGAWHGLAAPDLWSLILAHRAHYGGTSKAARQDYIEKTIARALADVAEPDPAEPAPDPEQDQAEVDRLVDRAATDKGAPFEDGAISFLAELARRDPAAHERARARLKGVGVRVGRLDEAIARGMQTVRAAATGEGGRAGQGRPLDLPEIEPWPDRVDGLELANSMLATLRRFVVLGDHAAVGIVLWVLHAHAHEAAFHSPRLAITSPVLRCGKSSLLRVIYRLVPRPLPTSNISAAAVFRVIEAAYPTLLIDELDQVDPEKKAELVGIINSSHCRLDAQVIRTAGEQLEPRAFSTWSPMALAAIGKLAATWADRSIIIEMARKLAGDRAEGMRLDQDQGFQVLRRKACRWAQDHLEELRRADPKLPAGLNDRQMDNWRLMCAIGDVIGGEWVFRTRAAALALSKADDDSDTRGIQALADIRDIFKRRGIQTR